MAGSCGPMVGGGRTLKEKSLVAPMELWPPTSNSSTVDEKSASQLLFLTVEYVEEGSTMPSNPSLFDPAVSESLPEFQPRVASPLDSNLESMARYSPLPALSKSEGTTISESIYSDSFSSPPVDVFQTPASSAGSVQEQNTQLIIMDAFYPQRGGQLSDLDPPDVEDFSNSEYILPILPEASDKLLLDSSSLNSSELLISVEDAASIFPSNKSNGRIELLLSNGNIAYGLIDSISSPRVLQIPKEYLVNSGRLSLDDAALESDAELKSILVGKSHDPKWNPSSLDSPFPSDSRSDLLSGSLLKEEPSVILNEDNLSDDLSKNISLDNTDRNKTLGGPLPDGDLSVDSAPFWCDECNCFYATDCIKHLFQTISDKPVLSRARASLPASYLYLNEIKTENRSVKEVVGVYARKLIPKQTQFGPIEGSFQTVTSAKSVDDHKPQQLKFSVEIKPEEFIELDVSDDAMSNWMKFVRPAEDPSSQNLRLCQQGKFLYFITTKTIYPKQELRVWYSTVYACKRSLPLLENAKTDRDSNPDSEEISNDKGCDVNLDSFSLDDESTDSSKATYLWKKKNKKLATFQKSKLGNRGNQKKEFACDFCDMKFHRYSRLTHHLLVHKEREENSRTSPVPKKEEINERLDSDKENKSDPEADIFGINGKRRYCHKCFLVFPNVMLYEMHMLSHSKPKKEVLSGAALWVCPQCHAEFRSKHGLSQHVTVHSKPWHGSLPYYCVRCKKTLANADRWKRHEAVHKIEDSKPYGCSFCIRRFLTRSALLCHMSYHDTTEKTFDCPICKASFTRVSPLKAHIHLHRVNGIYKCPHCPKEYPQYMLIRKHIRSFHSDRKFVCPVCGKDFPTSDKLRLHSLKHSDHREFLCSQCGKQFKRKDKLKAHIDRMHSVTREKMQNRLGDSSPKPNGGKKFISKLVVNNLDYNRYFYKCHSCMVGFKRRGMLVNHLANRHPQIAPESVPELSLPILKTRRNYYCQYCDKIYKSSSKRKVHILKNHPGLELPLSNRLKAGSVDVNQLPNASYSRTVDSVTSNPHPCPWCHKQYASKAKLLQHQRGKHKELMPKLPAKPAAKSSDAKTKTTCDPEKQDSDMPKASSPISEAPRENLPDLSNNCGLPTTDAQYVESREASNNVKRTAKDALAGVDWLSQAFTILGPALADQITYVSESNGQQTCTLNLTTEQYSKIMEQTPNLDPTTTAPNLQLIQMPLSSDSPPAPSMNHPVRSDPGISQSMSPYAFSPLPPIYSTSFTAR